MYEQIDDSKTAIDAALTKSLMVTYSGNYDQHVIIVGEDRARLCLSKWQDQIKNNTGFAGPLVQIITLLLTITTSTFHDTIRISAEAWLTIFILILGGAILWFLQSFLKSRNSAKPLSLDEIIDQLKKKPVA